LAAAATAAATVAGYERLREQALAGHPGAWRLGHGLLLGKGLAAWLAVCTVTLSTTAPLPARAATTPTARPGAVPGGAPAAALVSVLAQMALAHC